MAGEWLVWAACGIVLACLIAALFAYPLRNRRTLAGLAVSAFVWAALLAAALFAGEVRSVAAALLFTITGTAAALPAAAVFAALKRPVIATALAAAAWTALALVPPAVLLFGNGSVWILETLGVLDYAGALVIAVPASGVVLALRLVRRRSTPPRPAATHPLVGAGLIWTGVLAWLAGSELMLSDATGGILLSAVVTPVVSAAGWAVVERIRLARNTVAAASSGAIAGIVAVLAAAPYVDLLWSMALGAVVGPVTAAVAFGGHQASSSWRGSLRHLLAILPAAGAAGIVFLGLFAAERGLVYSGKADVFLTQIAALLLVTGWAAVIGALVAIPLRSPRPLARHRGALPARNGVA